MEQDDIIVSASEAARVEGMIEAFRAIRKELIDDLTEARNLKPDDKDEYELERAAACLLAVHLFLQKISVPEQLIAPLMHMHAGLEDLSEGRSNELLRRATMRPNTPKKRSREMQVSVAASAVVDVLMEYGHKSLTEALRKVSSAVGIPDETLKSFRDNISRRQVSKRADEHHEWMRKLLRSNEDGLSPLVRAEKILAEMKRQRG